METETEFLETETETKKNMIYIINRKKMGSTMSWIWYPEEDSEEVVFEANQRRNKFLMCEELKQKRGILLLDAVPKPKLY